MLYHIFTTINHIGLSFESSGHLRRDDIREIGVITKYLYYRIDSQL